MNEFKPLLESELLSEETKSALLEAVKSHEVKLRESIKDELEVEYASKFEKQKTEMNAVLIGMVNESVDQEFKELREDVQKSLNMESEYAAKLVSETERLAEEFNQKAIKLIESAVDAEFKELREDLSEARKNAFGMQVFNAVKTVFEHQYKETEEGKQLAKALSEAKQYRLRAEEAETRLDEIKRDTEISALLEGLDGRARSIMRTILEGTETGKLQERYDAVIEDVLQESATPDRAGDDQKNRSMIVNESVLDTDEARELRSLINHKS